MWRLRKMRVGCLCYVGIGKCLINPPPNDTVGGRVGIRYWVGQGQGVQSCEVRGWDNWVLVVEAGEARQWVRSGGGVPWEGRSKFSVRNVRVGVKVFAGPEFKVGGWMVWTWSVSSLDIRVK